MFNGFILTVVVQKILMQNISKDLLPFIKKYVKRYTINPNYMTTNKFKILTHENLKYAYIFTYMKIYLASIEIKF